MNLGLERGTFGSVALAKKVCTFPHANSERQRYLSNKKTFPAKGVVSALVSSSKLLTLGPSNFHVPLASTNAGSPSKNVM